ncbi:tetratricopeptide repeat protein [Patescibacteria group bacterium]
MNIAIWEISIIIALTIVFSLILRKLPQARTMLNKPFSETKNKTSNTKQTLENHKSESIKKEISEIQMLIENNRLPEAEKKLLDLVVRNPKNGDIYEKLGLVYLKQKNFTDCIQALKEALKYKKDITGNIYNNLGLAFFNLKEYPKSIENYRMSIDLDKKAVSRYINLSLSQKALGQAQDAIRTLKRAQKINPHDLDVQKLLKSTT